MRKHFDKCYVWSVFLYGYETWTDTEQDKKILETTQNGHKIRRKPRKTLVEEMIRQADYSVYSDTKN